MVKKRRLGFIFVLVFVVGVAAFVLSSLIFFSSRFIECLSTGLLDVIYYTKWRFGADKHLL